ncbi:MAG: hypothetical protein ACXAD7_17535 [Candidatus Kariarchaeaceae archaeon]|jgi:hypothetical protein
MRRIFSFHGQILVFLTVILLFFTQASSASIHLAPKAHKTPEDISYAIGSEGNTLTWQYEAEESADFPTTYTVSIDDVPLTGYIDQAWEDQVDIVVNVDGLAIGTHTVKIIVDDNGSDTNQAPSAVDEVIVSVTGTGATNTTSSDAGSSSQTNETSTEVDTSEKSTESESIAPRYMLFFSLPAVAILYRRYNRS